jgi:3-isopropylmalate/(R)-2-methylmalate dehydratase large subunit
LKRARTLVEKIWDIHRVADLPDGRTMVHIDRHLVHDLTSPQAFSSLADRRRAIADPALTLAISDHMVSTAPGRGDESAFGGRELIVAMRENARRTGIRLFDVNDADQGIVHVVGPELGIALPGLTLVCGDSHTCTVGGVGALAWGIGTSEIEHVLATQTLALKRPGTMRVRLEGQPHPRAGAKDLALHVIRMLGTSAGAGYAVEYSGGAVRSMAIESRLTLCNMSIELGARMGLVAPDDTTFNYLAGRRHAPRGALWDSALDHWRTLRSDDDATFDRDETIDVSNLAPQISWGNSPQDVVAIDEGVPDPAEFRDLSRREAALSALQYMGIKPGKPLVGLPIDFVFIGSCTNARITDLREAAAELRGRRIDPRVTGFIVPGSMAVKRQAEEEGLARVFIEAGFQWREPGCSMCAGVNGDLVPSGMRSISTTNRNFRGRQGPGSRTHLASPAMAAAAAVAGCIVDIRGR